MLIIAHQLTPFTAVGPLSSHFLSSIFESPASLSDCGLQFGFLTPNSWSTNDAAMSSDRFLSVSPSVTLSLAIWFGSLWIGTSAVAQISLAPTKAEGCIRVATFNVSMNRSGQDRLTEDLNRGDDQIRQIAAIIRNVRPDVVLLNEIDYSTTADNAKLFESLYLADPKTDSLGNGPLPLPHIFTAPVNTGVPSGLDLNKNGRTDDPEDAWGFGRFPGQYGMAVLSRFEIDQTASRSFQNLLWASLDNPQRPIDPATNKPYYDDATWKQLRLSSKSHWDVVIKANGKTLHLLASHPTPPAFDGPEDRNGCRNQDEIRMWVDYISPIANPSQSYWIDDQGRKGNLASDANFVIAGDLNSDPVDGNNRSESIKRLLDHPRVNSQSTPQSFGAVQAAEKQGQKNKEHSGKPEFDTGDFNDQVVGNLRIDYVLPSKTLKVKASGVVWPKVDEGAANAEQLKKINDASDHHLVWIDIEL